MKLTVLDNCVYLLTAYWVNDDTSVINLLLNPHEMEIINLDLSFEKELNINLIEKETTQGKKDLIKHYIYEFREFQGIFLEMDWLLKKSIIRGMGSEWFYTYPQDGVEKRANLVESYFLAAHELFNLLFTSIQNCCIKYDFNMFDLCNELNFRTDIFDSSPTNMYLEYQYETKQKEKLRNEPGNDSNNCSPALHGPAQSDVKIDDTHESSLLIKEKLKDQLTNFGFFTLEKIKCLSQKNIDTLIEEIHCNDTPFKIAMLDYLGFIKCFEKEFQITKRKRDESFAKILNTTERNIRGNINVLTKNSKEKRTRYSARKYIEKVESFYINLK